MKRHYIAVIALLLLVNSVTITVLFTSKVPVKNELRKCIEKSDYTDFDICHCLHEHGESDCALCGDDEANAESE